jgi:hypothetical protein
MALTAQQQTDLAKVLAELQARQKAGTADNQSRAAQASSGAISTQPVTTSPVISAPVTATKVQPSGSLAPTTGVVNKAPTNGSIGLLSTSSSYAGVSVVDYLKSAGQASDYNSRATLAAKYGITGYSGTAAQNTQLLNLLRGGQSSGSSSTIIPSGSQIAPKSETPQNASEVSDSNTAKSFINSEQDAAASLLSSSDDVPIRSSVQNFAEMMAEAKKAMGIGSTTATAQPAVPNTEQAYKDSLANPMGSLGGKSINEVESSLSEINAQIDDINARYRVNATAEKGKPVAMNVIEGRMTEQQQNASDQLVALNAQKSTLTQQLSTAYSIVGTIMNAKQTDYQNATESYNTQLSQTLQLFNVVKGISDDQKSEEETANDNARANAQILYNAISSGATDIATWSDSEKLTMSRLEVQSGLPMGFYQTLQNKNPKSTILSTTTRQTADGSKYADVIIQGSDGQPTVQSVYLGQEKLPASDTKDTTEADTQKAKEEIMDYADKLVQAMRATDSKKINWASAWSKMHQRYPDLSTKAIDNLLGLDNRAKYDK